MNIQPQWLAPTWFIDSDSMEVARFADAAAGDAAEPVEVARGQFYAVRDEAFHGE